MPTIGRPLKLTFLILAVAALLFGAICNGLAAGGLPGRPDLADFNVFMLVGHLVATGRLHLAYAMATLFPLQQAISGRESFMPWSYPPLFGLLLAPPSLLPVGVAHLLFAGGGFAFYWAALRRLDAARCWPVLLAMTPAILLNLRLGQNGLLTGGLLAVAACWLLRDRARLAGVPIAAMAIKPHLLPLLPLWLLLERRWTSFAVAAVGALALTGASILVLGWPVFLAWLGSFTEVARFMAKGAYPIDRMTSIYVFALGCGVPSGIALGLHGLVALGVAAATLRAMARTESPRVGLGLALMAGLFVSPYVYDYDQTIFGLGLLLLAPTLERRLGPWSYGCLLVATAAGQIPGLLFGPVGIDVPLDGPVLLGVYAIVLRRIAEACRVNDTAVRIADGTAELVVSRTMAPPARGSAPGSRQRRGLWKLK